MDPSVGQEFSPNGDERLLGISNCPQEEAPEHSCVEAALLLYLMSVCVCVGVSLSNRASSEDRSGCLSCC